MVGVVVGVVEVAGELRLREFTYCRNFSGLEYVIGPLLYLRYPPPPIVRPIFDWSEVREHFPQVAPQLDSTLLTQVGACLPVCLSVCLSVWLAVCLPACLSVCLPACLSVYLSACLFGCLLTCLPACLSVYLSVSLSIYLSVCLSVCPPVCLSVCLFLYSLHCYISFQLLSKRVQEITPSVDEQVC